MTNAESPLAGAPETCTYKLHPRQDISHGPHGLTRMRFYCSVDGEEIVATALVATTGIVVDLQADSAVSTRHFTAGTTGHPGLDGEIRARCARIVAFADGMDVIKRGPASRRPLRICDLAA